MSRLRHVLLPVLANQAPAWTPETPLSGVSPTGWYKSNFGLWKDAAKTQAATVDDDLIYTWANKVTGDGDFTQATEGKRFKLKTVNGKVYLRSDGSDDFLLASWVGARSALTLFVVCKKVTSPTTSDRALISLAANTASNVLTQSTSFGVGFGYALNEGSATVTLGGNCENLSVVCLKYTDTAHCTAYIDDLDGVAFDPQDGYAGTFVVLGARSSGNAKWCDGDFAEVLMYPAVLSDADRITAKQYLQRGWTNPT